MKKTAKVIVIGIILSILFSPIVFMNDNEVEAIDYISGELPPPASGNYLELPVKQYQLTGDIVVPAGKTLVVKPGTTFFVTFGKSYSFIVNGQLICDGKASDPIYFMSNRTGPRTVGDWTGIIINNGYALFNHTVIESASTAMDITSAQPELNYVIMRDSSIGMDVSGGSHPRLYNVTIENCIDRDIKLTASNLNMSKTILRQTVIPTNNPSIELSSGSSLKALNSSISDTYKYTVELAGNSITTFIQTSLNHSISRIRLNDPSSKVLVKNFLNIYVATKNLTGIAPIPNATVVVLDDSNANYNKKTNADGEVNWLLQSYREYSLTHPNSIHRNVTDININYENIFQPIRKNINMSTTHQEDFINDIPTFNFATQYTIMEDSKNDRFIDLWSVIDDDFDPDPQLTIELVENTGETINGKSVVGMKITDNRYLNVDIATGEDNDNWTGNFSFRVSATDVLGLNLGLKNYSAYIPIIVQPVNDPPRWLNMSDIHLKEDKDFMNVMDVRDHITDVDSDLEDIEFEVVQDYDKTNFLITIDFEDKLHIDILNENVTEGTSVTLSAYDLKDYGNYSLQIVIDKEQDAPAINKTIPDIKMNEDSINFGTIYLDQIFTDSDGDKLTYSYSVNEHITVEIDNNTSEVTLKPDPNWFGEETLTFSASDSLAEVDTTALIIVNGVNDPPQMPVIIHPSESEDKTYKVGEPIVFSAHAFDIDIDNPDVEPEFIDDKLTYTWQLNDSAKSILNILSNFTYSDLPEGHHRITVTVKDSEDLTAQSYVDVVIFGEYEAPTVTHRSPFPDYWTSIPNVRLEWDVQADKLAVPFVRYDVFVDDVDGTTLVAEKIKTTSYTVSNLRDGVTYYWTIVPYISNEPGIDLSGVWFFTYDKEFEPYYDLSLQIAPAEETLLPGQNATITITVTNLGNMPDKYDISIEAESVLNAYLVLSTTSILGEGDRIYGMTQNEKETVTLTINIPKDYDFSDTYMITISVQSFSRDTKKSEELKLNILELEDDTDGDTIVNILSSEESFLLYIIILIIVIIIAVTVIAFALYHKRRLEEEEAEEEEEEEGEERIEPGIPTTMPAPVPAPVPTQIFGESIPEPTQVPVAPVSEAAAPAPEPPALAPVQAPGAVPTPAPAPVPISSHIGEVPRAALPEGEPDVAAAGTQVAEGEITGEEAEKEGVVDLGTVMCGPCGSEIPLTSKERPLEVICAECGNKFTVK